ncbi:hypothetical protein ACFSKU_06175 [Pontibacter silvestris]|uniref:Uncharacterized protein n=1 Tax=Pontibacter silvestris TaxID=2305183 RepID=A0ABW4WW66_9BACT|nr:hypothetical protein [Pontibacter silvestris]MCC9136421.1 hypothetical protein [Pontibacter silvestris]
MKKVLGLLFVAGLFVFASCGGEATTETETTEPAVEEAPPMEETTVDTANAPIDTTGAAADTTATM